MLTDIVNGSQVELWQPNCISIDPFEDLTWVGSDEVWCMCDCSVTSGNHFFVLRTRANKIHKLPGVPRISCHYCQRYLLYTLTNRPTIRKCTMSYAANSIFIHWERMVSALACGTVARYIASRTYCVIVLTLLRCRSLSEILF